MATLYKDKGNPNWFARFTDANGKRISRSTRTPKKREAMAIANDLEAREREKRRSNNDLPRQLGHILEVATREAIDGNLALARAEELIRKLHERANPGYQSVTLEQHLDRWVDPQADHVSDSTMRVYRDMVRRFLSAFGPRIAQSPVGDLTQEDVQKAHKKITETPVKGSGRKIVASTANLDLRCLRRALQGAVKQGLARLNPAEDVRPLPETTSTERAPFSAEEVRKLIDHESTPEDWKGAILIAAHTGLRLGDVISLSDKNLKDTKLVIRPEKTKAKQKAVTVPLTPPCLKWVGDRKGDFFESLKGRKTGTLSTQFVRIMERAEVPREVTIDGGITARRSFHSLRHSFASWLAEADVHADVRQRLTGHASAGVHARYTHHDEALERAVASLPDLMS